MAKKKTGKKKSKKAGKAVPQLVAQHPRCAQCIPAKCCRYFSLEVDRPRSKRDYDDLLWMLAHQDVSVYVDKKKWYLMVHTQCKFLDMDTNCCTIYDTRPQMCREHSVDECEWHGPWDFDKHFMSYEELKQWMKKKDLL